MSNAIKEARSFFKKAIQPENDFTEGFEAKSLIPIPTIAIPVTIELTEQEKNVIQKILVDEYQPGTIHESQVERNIQQLTDITKQIKSIAAQSVLLHGERIKQAQELLSNYREGAFTKWLMSTYKNRQTPYSMLRYYEFYQSAPKETRLMIESAPKKCVYLLASREGNQSKKFDLIKEHGKSTQSDLLILIQTAFPIQESDKRKPLNTLTIESMSKLCKKLEIRCKYISEEDRMDIQKLIDRLQRL
jgi:Uncharacterised protein family (UPF0137)